MLFAYTVKQQTFYYHEILQRPLSVNRVILSIMFILLLHINCILFTGHPEDGSRGYRNMFVKE